MMQVYRLANTRRATDLSGTGARLSGGRWNRPGFAVLYTASSRALATLEVLVHTAIIHVPDYYQMLTLLVPEDSFQTVPFDQLPTGWSNPQPPDLLKDITESWILENRFLLLKVPSAVVEGDYNFLINPAHPRFIEVTISQTQPYRFDERLWRSNN